MIEPILDVSHWQGDIDEEKLLSTNVIGLIIRAGSINSFTGECYYDYHFYLNWDKFYGKIPIGFYWYFRPEWSGEKQAEYFCNLINETGWDIPPTSDVESNSKRVSVGEFQKQLGSFHKITDLMTFRTSRIYTRAEFWNANVGNPSWAKKHPLHIARYTSLPKPWGNPKDKPWVKPLPWDDFQAWQYSADGNGRGEEFGCDSDDVDINRCNMTLKEFYEYANWNESPLPNTVFAKTNASLLKEPKMLLECNDTKAIILKGTKLEVLEQTETHYEVSLNGWVNKENVKES